VINNLRTVRNCSSTAWEVGRGGRGGEGGNRYIRRRETVHCTVGGGGRTQLSLLPYCSWEPIRREHGRGGTPAPRTALCVYIENQLKYGGARVWGLQIAMVGEVVCWGRGLLYSSHVRYAFPTHPPWMRGPRAVMKQDASLAYLNMLFSETTALGVKLAKGGWPLSN
jgi:hypothetical protein